MVDATLEHAVRLIESGRTEEGVDRLRHVASSGNPQALFLLADMTWSGNKVPQDPARGRLLFEYAAALGHTQANLVTTNLLANGIAGKRDWSVALERLRAEARQLPERAAMLGLIEAMDLDSRGDPKAVPTARILSDQPYARVFEGMMTPPECDYLIQAAGDLFHPSMVYDKDGRTVPDKMRTSDGAGFNWLLEDPAIHALNRRVAKATGTTYEEGEALQVLRYTPGQEYRPHFDFLLGVDNPRPWTALIYLNEGYEGGETAFVQTGVKFRGHTGDVLLFRNRREDGSRDPLAEHAGLPVISGIKYLATRWIRERRFVP
jgi:prolyl 4-hydroxylase